MQKLLSIFLVFFLCIGFVMSDAHAKRFGGGRSFGAYRSTNSYSRAQPASVPFQNTATANRSKWLGPLAGLAAGGLLASLFMGHGMGSGIMSWLLIAAAIMFLLPFIRGLLKPSPQAAATMQPNTLYRENTSSNYTAPQPFQSAASFTHQNNGMTQQEEDDFLRNVKVQFIRLQAAYDQKNLQDISQFTTPEIFAEIKLQLQERGDKNNITDVIKLDAKLLEATNEYQTQSASVEFSGVIKEEIDQLPTIVNEIWHFRKEANQQHWLVTGIQQN